MWSRGSTKAWHLLMQRFFNKIQWVHQALTLSCFVLYFRNPDADEKPWCFIKVSNDKVKWEYCDVSACTAQGKGHGCSDAQAVGGWRFVGRCPWHLVPPSPHSSSTLALPIHSPLPAQLPNRLHPPGCQAGLDTFVGSGQVVQL